MEDLDVGWVGIFVLIIMFVIVYGMLYEAFLYKYCKTSKNNRLKNDELRLVLFANGLYENETKPNNLWENGIINSDFNVILLWTLHITQDGNFRYNDDAFITNGILNPIYGPNGLNIAGGINRIKNNGNTTRSVFVSIGSGSWIDSEGNEQIAPDWYNLYKILFNGTQTQIDNLYDNFNVLISLGIDGIDSDCEEWGFFTELTTTMIENTHIVLFSELYNQYPNILFSFCPYNYQQNWINIGKALYQVNGTQIVSFWTIQMYGPGSGTVISWVNGILNNKNELGLTDKEIESYIIPGYNNSAQYAPQNTPERIELIFNVLKFELDNNINGGMIWNMEQCYQRGSNVDINSYSQSIINGLSVGNKSITSNDTKIIIHELS